MDFFVKYIKYKYKYNTLKAGGKKRGSRGGEKVQKVKTNFTSRLLEYKDIYMNPIFIGINVKDHIYDCKSYNYYLDHKKNACNQDKLCIFMGDRCKNINPQDDISEEKLKLQSIPYTRCIDMKGISQTIGTCWFDSTIMALITDFELRQIWGPYLYSKFGYTLNELDIVDNRKQLLSTLSIFAKSFKQGIPLKDVLLSAGYSIILLHINFANNYNKEFKTERILNCWLQDTGEQYIRTSIIDIPFIIIDANYIFNILTESTAFHIVSESNSIKIKADHDVLLILVQHKNVLPPLELKANGYIYNLKSIVLTGFNHAISILKCNNNWYIYDNENSKRNVNFNQLQYGILNINSIDYLYQLENIGPINMGYLNLNIATEGNTYIYCKN